MPDPCNLGGPKAPTLPVLPSAATQTRCFREKPQRGHLRCKYRAEQSFLGTLLKPSSTTWCLPDLSWPGRSVLPVAGCFVRMGPRRGSESFPSGKNGSLWSSGHSLPESQEVPGRVPWTVAGVAGRGEGDHKRCPPHLFARRMRARRSQACRQ